MYSIFTYKTGWCCFVSWQMLANIFHKWSIWGWFTFKQRLTLMATSKPNQLFPFRLLRPRWWNPQRWSNPRAPHLDIPKTMATDQNGRGALLQRISLGWFNYLVIIIVICWCLVMFVVHYVLMVMLLDDIWWFFVICWCLVCDGHLGAGESETSVSWASPTQGPIAVAVRQALATCWLRCESTGSSRWLKLCINIMCNTRVESMLIIWFTQVNNNSK